MRIGIDARPLEKQQRTGVGNYLYELLREIPELAPQHEYILYFHRDFEGNLPGPCIRRQIDARFAKLPGSFWLLSRVGQFARKDQLDVFWSTASVLPLWVPKNVLKVVTVYDLVWMRFPETMQVTNLWLHRIRAADAIRKSDRIITISHSTAKEIISSFDVAQEKIRLVYPGISEAFRPRDTLAAAQYISRKYKVAPQYMAAVGTLEPRKNLTLLIRVLQLLENKGCLACPLLIVGASGWKNSYIFREIQESGLTDQEIQVLGYMPEEDLPLFYAGAKLFLFPSLYEGFGLPPVEAMACGTPVIASNAQSMPEVLSDAAILESPSNPVGFAQAITDLLSNEELRCKMRERGLQRANLFRLESSARQLLDALCGT